MKNRVVDILPKIPQYESIPYAADFNCPECDKSGFFTDWPSNRVKPNMIGWTETNIGYMAVFECPLCGQKFRFHCTVGTWIADIDEFDYYLYIYAQKCANWDDIKKELNGEA